MRSKNQTTPAPTFDCVWALLQEFIQEYREIKKRIA
jgi:hypothetical protein